MKQESEELSSNILGNLGFPFSKTLSNLLSPIKGTLLRRKGSFHSSGGVVKDNGRSYLAPALPPIAPTPKLRRINSSTLSLNTERHRVLTVEDLYVEILYSVHHMVGSDVQNENKEYCILTLKEAFKMSDEKHEYFLQMALSKEAPLRKLHLEIFEAKDLIGKDMSGFSDPFCTFYLVNTPRIRYNSSYKPRTLNPEWNEDFVLDVEDTENDKLRIDVWDFNPDENVAEKFKKINEIKDRRGLRKFIKETLSASTGKITHELLGSLEIPLQSIPSSGLSKWFSLAKPETKSRKARGSLSLSLSLSFDKDPLRASQEHRHLLKILFAHEIQKENPAPFCWKGHFSLESALILAQHAVQGRLTGAETALARWLVYVHTHCDLPLDYKVFIPLLEKLRYAFDHSLLETEEESKFFEVASVFCSHCLDFIKKHRSLISSNVMYIIQLEHIVKCCSLLMTHSSSSSCSSSHSSSPSLSSSIVTEDNKHIIWMTSHLTSLTESLKVSLRTWLSNIISQLPESESNDNLILRNLTSLVTVITENDLKETCLQLHSMFHSSLHIDYMAIAYEVYETMIIELVQPVVEKSLDKVQPLVFSENLLVQEDEQVNEAQMNIGAVLFELYLTLRRLSDFSKEIYGISSPSGKLSLNYLWFNRAVSLWLDIALIKGLQRIYRSVKLDNCKALDEFVKHSLSAIDMETILVQIKNFWFQLHWPDVEASYAFLSKILDNVCKITIFYAEKMTQKVSCHQMEGQSNIVTSEFCVAMNNIDHVKRSITPFGVDLGLDDIIYQLRALDGNDVAVSCERTLATLLLNAKENMENKILLSLYTLGEKMGPFIQRFLVDGGSLASSSKEPLISYLDENLILLKDKLTDSNFDRILSIIWESSAQSLNDTIYLSIQKRKSPSYFKDLLDTLKILINFFYGDKLPQDETLLKMKNLLSLYASNSSDLISRHLAGRYSEQNSTENETYGSLTFRCQITNNTCRVEILNARNLKPAKIYGRNGESSKYIPSALRRRRMQSIANVSSSRQNLSWMKFQFKSLKENLHQVGLQVHCTHSRGLCDPYVSLRLIFSEGQFLKLKSKTQRRTLFPLFDETFEFSLPTSKYEASESYLLLTLKDVGLFGRRVFLGEALLPLSRIPITDEPLFHLPQLQLPLTKPKDEESDVILALDSRDFDRLAKTFLSKEKQKIISY